MPHANRRLAFSLTELLIVLVIATLVIGVIVSSVLRIRAAAERAKCHNNLKQLALAVHSFCDAHSKRMPQPGHRTTDTGKQVPAASIHYLIEPYSVSSQVYGVLGQAAANCDSMSEVADINQYPLAGPMYAANCLADSSTATGVVGIGPGRYAVTNYAANLAVFGHARYGTPPASIPDSFPDGTSTTILLAERLGRCNGVSPLWLNPGDGPPDPVFAGRDAAGRFEIRPPQVASPFACDPRAPQALHGGTVGVAMADGTVRAVRVGITPATWRAAVLPNDGANLGSDW